MSKHVIDLQESPSEMVIFLSKLVLNLFVGLYLVVGVLFLTDGWHRGKTTRWLSGIVILLFYPVITRAYNRVKW
jgi:hypothetical protein